MRVDHLVHKAGLTQGNASEIEVGTQNSGGHDAKADCRDLRRESELSSVNIEECRPPPKPDPRGLWIHVAWGGLPRFAIQRGREQRP